MWTRAKRLCEKMENGEKRRKEEEISRGERGGEKAAAEDGK